MESTEISKFGELMSNLNKKNIFYCQNDGIPVIIKFDGKEDIIFSKNNWEAVLPCWYMEVGGKLYSIQQIFTKFPTKFVDEPLPIKNDMGLPHGLNKGKERDFYNTGSLTKPTVTNTNADIKDIMTFITQVLLEQDEGEYVLDYLADYVQNPTMQRQRPALAFLGKQGTGKSFLLELFASIYPDNCLKGDNNVYDSRFNIQLKNKIFVGFDEWNYRKGLNYFENHKRLLFGLERVLEQKGKNFIKDVNYTRTMYVSNSEYIFPNMNEGGARRFSIFKCNKYKLKDGSVNVLYDYNLQKHLIDKDFYGTLYRDYVLDKGDKWKEFIYRLSIRKITHNIAESYVSSYANEILNKDSNLSLLTEFFIGLQTGAYAVNTIEINAMRISVDTYWKSLSGYISNTTLSTLFTIVFRKNLNNEDLNTFKLKNNLPSYNAYESFSFNGISYKRNVRGVKKRDIETLNLSLEQKIVFEDIKQEKEEEIDYGDLMINAEIKRMNEEIDKTKNEIKCFDLMVDFCRRNEDLIPLVVTLEVLRNNLNMLNISNDTLDEEARNKTKKIIFSQLEYLFNKEENQTKQGFKRLKEIYATIRICE